MAGRSAHEPGNQKDIQRRELARQALELRAAGASYRAIGSALGIDHKWARALVLRLLNSVDEEHVLEKRTLEGQRLDRMQASLWQAAMSGTTGERIKANGQLVGIMRLRKELFGLGHDDEVAERQVRVNEAIAMQLFQVLNEVITDLKLTPAQRARADVIIPERLRAISAPDDDEP